MCPLCRLPPRAKSLRAEELWNVAYHGTAVGNVRSILDCGGLLLPGGCGHLWNYQWSSLLLPR